MRCCISCFFFFNDTATTEIYTLSLHDALPIFGADEHPFTRIVDNHFIEEAFTRSAQRARMFPALDLERMVVEIEAAHGCVRRNRVNATFAARPEQLQRRVHMPLRISPLPTCRRP